MSALVAIFSMDMHQVAAIATRFKLNKSAEDVARKYAGIKRILWRLTQRNSPLRAGLLQGWRAS